MLYWLTELTPELAALNIFRYITFRTGGALITALLFVFLFGPVVHRVMRSKQGKGQPIRRDGPERHVMQKQGTPTMGGLMILVGRDRLSAAVGRPAQPLCLGRVAS